MSLSLSLSPLLPRPLRRRAGPALVTTALLALTACSGSTEADAGGDAAERLRLALNFPPAAALSPYSEDAVLLTRMGTAETLVVFDEDGIAQPALASSWEFVDPSTVELTLRDDVLFHDGTPMDAEAAAAALTRAAEAPTPPRSLSGQELDFTAVDTDTLRVQAAEADPLLVQRLAAPGTVVLAPAAYAQDPETPNPVGHGTGPFRLTEVQGSSAATLDANAEYWDGEPALAGVDVRFVGDAAARAAGIRADEFDVAQNLPIAQLGQLGTDVEVQSLPLSRLVGVYLTTSGGSLSEPALRAAARAALDPEPVVDGVYEGEADPAEGLLRAGDEERPEPAYREPGRASGQTIRLATYDDRPELPEAASLVADQLRAAGFTVEVIVQAYSTIEPKLLAGDFDAVLASRLTLGDTGDPVGYLETDFTCDGSFNPARLCDAALDQAIAAAAGVVDPEERREQARELEARVLATDAFVPLLHERARTAVAPSVRELAADPFERILVTARTTLS